MNTTHRAPRKAVDLPDLPSEIWLKILRIATWVNCLIDPRTSLDISLSSMRKRKRNYRDSLVTKRYLVRVCKQWNAWASPYLYESVYLGRGRSLCALRDALIKSEQENPTSEHFHPLGWWTKRLDLAMRDMSSIDDEIQYTSDIVKCFPNLEVLCFAVTAPSFYRTFNFRHAFPESILQSLASTSGPTLQAVIWQRGSACPHPNDWHAFLEKAANIKTLCCPTFTSSQDVAHITLPSLESLFIQREPLEGDFPLLRYLITDVSPDTGWKHHIEIHGAKLEMISLNLQYHSTIAPLVALLTASCPKLRRLNLSVTSWHFVSCQVEGCHLALPPTVRVFGLQSTATQASRQGYKSLFVGLVHMKLTAKLDFVQLIDQGNVLDLCQKHRQILTRGLEMLEAKGLELRDHNGDVMK